MVPDPAPGDELSQTESVVNRIERTWPNFRINVVVPNIRMHEMSHQVVEYKNGNEADSENAG